MSHHQLRGIFVAILAFVLFSGDSARGNALSITNVAVLNASNGTAELHFDLSWSNSWRSVWTDGGVTFTTNWDGAWIFAKQRVSGGDWKPILFTTNGNSVAAGFNLKVAMNGGVTNPGALIYRNAEGAGSVNLPDVKLTWDYVASGLYGTNQVDYAVFATEMIYIPEGAYSLGSGGGEPGTFYTYPNASQPFRITNENSMTIGNITGALACTATTYSGTLSGVLSNTFPKGYAPFYAMKYEITQGQYVDFLNHISPGRALLRYPNYIGNNRHTISVTNSTTYFTTTPDRACNFINWDDVIIFLDWAGLRPLTEMEFEKMCRGVKPPVPGELAFGDITPTYASGGFIGVDGSGTETLGNPSSNISGGGTVNGPLRAGIFATATSDRLKSGAGYFGTMELSGNLWEMFISAGDTRGRSFVGEHGDGDVGSQPASWPTVGNAAGYGIRGGAFNSATATGLQVSYRNYGWYPASARVGETGGRGGHAVP